MGGQIESLLEKGISAARDNEKERARDILIRVIELDQHNEKAWLWLSSVVQTPTDKEVCLENALYINPDNTYAAMGLQHLRQENPLPSPTNLPRLTGQRTAAEREWAPANGSVVPPPRVRVCLRCEFRNPGWAYLCDRCGANLREMNLREAVREASKPRGKGLWTLLEAWGGTLIFDRVFAFEAERPLASVGRSVAALVLSAILSSAIRIVPATIVPVLVGKGQYDLRSRLAGDVLEWGKQFLLLGLALLVVWALATLLTWVAALLVGGRQHLKIHAHLVMVAISAWALLCAVAAAIVILMPYIITGESALELPFELVFDLVSIIIGLIGLTWLTQATRAAQRFSAARAIATIVLVTAMSALLLFGLDSLTDGLFSNAVAKPLLVFFLPWLGQ